jgi:hypothetical protein
MAATAVRHVRACLLHDWLSRQGVRRLLHPSQRSEGLQRLNTGIKLDVARMLLDELS